MRILARLLHPLLRRLTPCPPGARQRFPWCAVSWAALVTALAGCDGNGSVVHRARLDAKPDMQCMQQAVAGVPGIRNVVYLHAAAEDKPDFDEIAYDADDQRIMLMVDPDREYSQTFLRMGGIGSDGIAPRIRRVMASVDRAVEKACHLRNLSRKVRETCGEGAHPEGKCPPLAS